MVKTAIFQCSILYSNISEKHIFITGNTSETFWYSLWNFIDYIRGMVRVFVYVHRIVIWLFVRFVYLVIQIKTNIEKINYLLVYLTCDGKSFREDWRFIDLSLLCQSMDGDKCAHNHWFLIALIQKIGMSLVAASEGDTSDQNGKPSTPPHLTSSASTIITTRQNLHLAIMGI